LGLEKMTSLHQSPKWENLKCQIGTSSSDHGGKRKLPIVFNEQGIAFLLAVLRSENALNVGNEININ
jgi:hypothetical protein